MRVQWTWAVGAALAAVLSGCPQQGVVCQVGTDKCNGGCADFSADVRNCGACGNACGSGQECRSGVCACAAGTTSCDGACVVTATDARHCGGCGNACAPGDVCGAELTADGGVAASCRSTCAEGTVQCGQGCVDLSNDSQNCGACGVACDNQRSCRGGVCAYDVVLACTSFGQVTGVRASDLAAGPKAAAGTNPSALARYGAVLLSADYGERLLKQLTLSGFEALSNGGGAEPAVGSVPNQVLALPARNLVLVVNGDLGTLQALSVQPADGGAGLQLQTVGEVNFGANTYPQAVAVVGDTAWVPLYGGYSADTATAGQKVVPVDVSNPSNLVAGTPVDLAGLDLKPFSASVTAIARPYALVAWKGKLYAPLNNLDVGYQPAGPGMVLELDPETKGLSAVDLGAVCLNAAGLTATADALYVSCTGKVTYDTNYVATAVEKASVVKLGKGATGALEQLASWSVACPAGGACPSPGRLAVSGGRVFVADQAAGRVFVLSASDLSEVAGFTAGTPLQACPAPDGTTTFYSNVGDVLAP
ncbi:MAG: hypothetical protein RL653_70 [Pseudomonadota bacterium]|jgi:hypothetical protein